MFFNTVENYVLVFLVKYLSLIKEIRVSFLVSYKLELSKTQFKSW